MNTNYLRVLNFGYCKSCGHQGYDNTFEVTETTMVEPYTYNITTRMICPQCKQEDTFIFLNDNSVPQGN